MTEIRNLDIPLEAQKIELTEYRIFTKLAKKASRNKDTLEKLASDSLKHSQYWESITRTKVVEDKFKVWLYITIANIFGLTFTIKMLEKKEIEAEEIYRKMEYLGEKLTWIIGEEKDHENELIGLIDEDYLRYTSSIVLGSSDALVELTGTLAGLTLTLQNNQLIGATGLIMGIAASLSMASSEYLSTKSAPENKSPLRAAIYTGITYVVTTTLLILPYFLFNNYLVSLAGTLFNGALIILFSSFYLSVTKEISFKRRFIECISLSFGVALISFGIGIAVRQFLNINI